MKHWKEEHEVVPGMTLKEKGEICAFQWQKESTHDLEKWIPMYVFQALSHQIEYLVNKRETCLVN